MTTLRVAEASAIQARSITCVFGGDFKAVDSVSLEVKPGAIYGLVGPNGSGKTTLVRTLCGLRKPTSGSGTVLGYDVGEQAAEIRRTVGYMSQAFSLYPDLTVGENLNFFSGLYGFRGKEKESRIAEVIEITKLGPYVDRAGGALSGGWKQRLALATALLHRPPLLFLDEPTSGIDPVARRGLWDLLFQLASDGTTIFVTTQYMDEVERCSDVGYMYLSRLIATGTPRALKEHPAVKSPHLRHVEVECERTMLALQWFRVQPFCTSATVFGHTIHAVVDSRANDRYIYERCLVSGFKQARVRTIEPSLEDVFVALTELAAKGNAESAGD